MRGVREELGGVEEGETNQDTSREEKIFSITEKKKKIKGGKK